MRVGPTVLICLMATGTAGCASWKPDRDSSPDATAKLPRETLGASSDLVLEFDFVTAAQKQDPGWGKSEGLDQPGSSPAEVARKRHLAVRGRDHD